jgi:glucose-6-phosphate 1-dehydrogenase
MAQQIKTMVLLGASGDLSGRLLLPAIGELLDEYPDLRDLLLIGAGSEDWDHDAWRDRVRTSFTGAGVSAETLDAVLKTTQYVRADVTNGDDLRKLLDAGPAPVALYFALPPAVTVAACTKLREIELPSGTTLVLEKPFGTDAESAAGLNKLLAELVPEDQVHRVDHFLGRSTVLNLLGLRFANRLFEPVWNADHIERIDIVFDEQLTLENRARYYDRAGALMDMIQSHLLQILAVLTMEPITSVDAVEFREAKATVLRACQLWGDDPAKAGRRARYTGGTIEGREVPDYAAEPGVDPERNTETLAEVTLRIDNWRWEGVPFRLRSGKALRDRRKDALVTFKRAHHLPTGLRGDPVADQLRLSMVPDRIALELNVNGPEDPFELDRASLSTDLLAGRLPPYGEVLAGVLAGDPLLSVRGDTAEECWRIVDPVLEAWRENRTALDTYPAGSTGPAAWA